MPNKLCSVCRSQDNRFHAFSCNYCLTTHWARHLNWEQEFLELVRKKAIRSIFVCSRHFAPESYKQFPKKCGGVLIYGTLPIDVRQPPRTPEQLQAAADAKKWLLEEDFSAVQMEITRVP